MKNKLVIILLLLIAACNNEEDNPAAPSDLGVFVEYKITGEEGLDSVTCLFHFFDNGLKSASLVLEEPAKVELDGETLEVDSTPFTGAYYEVRKPIAAFKGEHTITFTNADKKKHTEKFRYTPFSIANVTADVVERNNWVLQLQGLQDGDVVRTVLLDTSFEGEGINELYTVENNSITITQAELQNLQSGPIILQLIKEEERPVTKGSEKVGDILITYSLKRELELMD